MDGATSVRFGDAETSFFGQQRTVTRQYLPYDATANATLDGTSNEPAPLVDDADDGGVHRGRRHQSVDPYAEAGYSALRERPEAADQARADLRSDAFAQLVEQRHVDASAGTDTGVRAREAAMRAAAQRRRAEVLAALRSAVAVKRPLLSIDYMAQVPAALAAEFASIIEVRAVRAALLPALFAVDEGARAHVEEMRWIRALFECGGKLVEKRTHVLAGHLRELAPAPPDDGGWYTRERLASEHAHHEPLTNTTPLRLLTFHVRSDAPSLTNADEAAAARADAERGFYVRLVAHLLPGSTDAEPLLCMRTFAFLRER